VPRRRTVTVVLHGGGTVRPTRPLTVTGAARNVDGASRSFSWELAARR
jgi:hypothetical protein